MPALREVRARVVPVHPLLWAVEPLEREPTFAVRAMFGGKAIYLDGRFVLYLTAKAQPWGGVLVPTEREHQPALIAELPALRPHDVLPKWLYLSEETPHFERGVAWLVARIRGRDPRVGILPAAKKRRRKVGARPLGNGELRPPAKSVTRRRPRSPKA